MYTTVSRLSLMKTPRLAAWSTYRIWVWLPTASSYRAIGVPLWNSNGLTNLYILLQITDLELVSFWSTRNFMQFFLCFLVNSSIPPFVWSVDDGSFPKANLRERSKRTMKLISERYNAIAIEAMSLLSNYDEFYYPGADGINQISLDNFICTTNTWTLATQAPIRLLQRACCFPYCRHTDDETPS
jgi:hypothetical protein